MVFVTNATPGCPLIAATTSSILTTDEMFVPQWQTKTPKDRMELLLGLADVRSYPEPEETELTFEGNALLKARACVAATGLPSLADDSGLGFAGGGRLVERGEVDRVVLFLLEHDVGLERLLHLRLQLEHGKLQQLDGLLQLRGHRKLLTELELQGRLEH